MSFRLVPNSVTFNDLERRNSPYIALFHRIRSLSRCSFYSACALFAMQTAVLARPLCLSVCHSATFRYCALRNEDTIVRNSASVRTIPLVSGEVGKVYVDIGMGSLPAGALK